MADYFESGVFTDNLPAWHGLGAVVEDEALTVADALRLGELDWTVELVPLYADYNGKRVMLPYQRGVQRSSDGRILGSVTDYYKPVQNVDAFAFGDALQDDGSAKVKTAGSLHNGEQVWVLMKAAKGIVVGGVESEAIDKYLLITNSHNGRGSLIGKWVRVRVVCANTLTAAMMEDSSEIRIRHTGRIDGKLAEARRVLDIGFAQDVAFTEQAEQLLAKKLTNRQWAKFLDQLVPYDPEHPSTVAEKKRDSITKLYREVPNLQNVQGTAWAAYNAVAEYHDHVVTSRGATQYGLTLDRSRAENRMRRIVGDTQLKDKALALLAA